jgi:hypothetical protein
MNVNEIIRKLGPAQRKKVEGRADEIFAEETNPQDVRIVAEFPDRAPVVLSERSEADRPRKTYRRHTRARA